MIAGLAGIQYLWLAFGGVAGVGLLNKHTFALLLFAFGVAMLASPLRAQLLQHRSGTGVAGARPASSCGWKR